MKKMVYACLLLFCMGLLSGCFGKKDADVSTVFLDGDGGVLSVDVETLDRDYYDTEELDSYIMEHIEEYTKSNGETVEKLSFDTEDGVAKLRMEYDSCEDYTRFNGIELYNGTVIQARAAGYDFEAEFYDISEDSENGGISLTKEGIFADDDNCVAIIRANVNVQVPGSVLYVSAKDAKLVSDDTVAITGTGVNEEAGLTYIIYK